MQKRHRIFIAINLPNEIKKRLAKYQEKRTEVPAKWTSLENLHVTLVFLGNINDQELAQVCQIVKQITESHGSFNIDLDKISYGPVGKISPRYVWIGGQQSQELLSLKRNLENALLESVRFKPDKNAFSPHITLARIKEWEWRAIEPEERPEIEENIELSFTVESVEVMESELKRGGPHYTVIESHQLQIDNELI